MIEIISTAERQARMTSGGLGEADARAWSEAVDAQRFVVPSDAASLDADAAGARPVFEQGWHLLGRMPLRSKRSPAEKEAALAVVHGMAEVCSRLSRAHGTTMYRLLTDEMTRPVRIDSLLWQGAERWPGLLPTKAAVEREAEHMQIDKDGLEINQGVFTGEIMADPACGKHLLLSMLHPTQEALAHLDEFIAKGRVDLGPVRVEAHGETGYLYFQHTKYLNAEDDEAQLPQEIGVDLILLHPDIRMGVIRGEVMEHPKYKGRRVFDSGINLTRIYNGKQSYLFYLIRDFGMMNKIYRGLAGPDAYEAVMETTLEIPWIAVVETHAIGGGCQVLLVVDYVIAEAGAYFNLPARKEGIIPGCANMRLPRFMGERMARQAIMFDKTFYVESPEAQALVNEVHPREHLDAAVKLAVENAIGSGMVSAGGNRKAIRVETEPLDKMREYFVTYASEQAFCHLSEQLTYNLERHWNAREKKLKQA
jgi:thioesterase DpgC